MAVYTSISTCFSAREVVSQPHVSRKVTKNIVECNLIPYDLVFELSCCQLAIILM